MSESATTDEPVNTEIHVPEEDIKAKVSSDLPDKRQLKRPRLESRVIEVHVVESHEDVVEYALHREMGAGRVPLRGLHWVHVDAHPDLLLPRGLSPEAALDPDLLYQALEASEGGLAEWLLPLVYARHVAQVVWVRSPWSSQLPDGSHSFVIAQDKASQQLRVSSGCAYYVEEGLSVALSSLAPPHVPCHLHVTPLHDPSQSPLVLTHPQQGECGEVWWVLDVCLDYFATANPFIAHLQQEWGLEVCEVLLGYFKAPTFRQPSPSTPLTTLQHQVSLFSSLTSRLLGHLCSVTDPTTTPLDRAAAQAALSHTITALTHSGLFHSQEEAEGLTGALVATLTQQGHKLVTQVCALGPHCATLPHCLPPPAQVECLLSSLEASITATVAVLGPPCLVLVARSAVDGYTPPALVNILEDKVLQVFQRTLATPTDATLKVTRHYQDDDKEEEKEDDEEGNQGDSESTQRMRGASRGTEATTGIKA